METELLLSQAELIEKARQCLTENEKSLDLILERGNAHMVRLEQVNLLIRHLCITEKEAVTLLDGIRAEDTIISEKIEQIRNISAAIQEIPWEILAREFSESYSDFCAENNLNPALPPPTDRAKEIIYWFNDANGIQKTVSLSLAYELLHDDQGIGYQEYFNKTYRGLS